MLRYMIRSALKAARAPRSACSVHGIVHETPRNEPDRARHLCTRQHAGPGISRGQHGSQSRTGTRETGVVVLITQRSQVQILPPLPISAGQRPFSDGERAFCAPGAVVKGVVRAGLRAAWRQDGMTRDKTTRTWWTLPRPISGCLAQRYRKCIPPSSHSCWTTRNMRKPGLGRGWARVASG